MVIKLNGKEYDCPVCHEEIKEGVYESIVLNWDTSKPKEKRDYFHLFCLLTKSDFKSFVATSENEVTIWNAIKWFVDTDFPVTNEIPKVLKIGDKIISIPKNLKALSIGANMHMRQEAEKGKILVDEKGNVVDYSCYSIATAIFLQPVYDGRPFDFDRAEEIKFLIDEMPAYLIRPIGFFLLANALPIGKRSGTHWLKFLNTLSKRSVKLWRKLRESIRYKALTTLISSGDIRSDSAKTRIWRYSRL